MPSSVERQGIDMSTTEAVEYFHSLEKFGIQPGLERISVLCERLGAPHKKLRFVHAAGTNGKGSTCTALASVLTAAGYRTGLYTSPYVIDFRERIQLDMKMISPEALVRVTRKVKDCINELASEGIRITEFEAVTAAAFLFFVEEMCDVVVLETGLGGRFDATNIIENPLCSIITSVSLDHVSILGNTIGEIAGEKAGIIKSGCPVITPVTQPAEVLQVLKSRAYECGSEFITADPKALLSEICEDITGTLVQSEAGQLRIPYAGRHQLENMSLVLSAVNVIRKQGFEITDENIKCGISTFRIPARTELICEKPLVILDGSHNEGSTSALSDSLKRHLKGKRILSVMGMMADKDCKKSLGNLMPSFTKVITVRPSNPRSMEPCELAAIASSYGVESIPAETPAQGIDKAFAEINNFDALVVCGSLYLAGDVRDYLINKCGEFTAEK